MTQQQITTTETLSNGYTVKHYVVPDLKRATLELWTEMVIGRMQSLPPDAPVFALHDFSRVPILTPTLRQYTSKVVEFGQSKGFPAVNIAVVLNAREPVALTVGKLFVERTLNRPSLFVKVFFNVDNATQWLETRVKEWQT